MKYLTLEILDSTDIKTKLIVLNYIRRKYPNLSTLRLINQDVYSLRENDQQDLYAYGWKPLVQALQTRLKKLHIDHTFVPNNILDLLHKCGPQTSHLSIGALLLKNLGRPSQLHHTIQYLELDTVNCSSFEWLKEFKAIRKLKLTNACFEDRPTINFNDLVRFCPDSLKSLSFKYVDLSCDPVTEVSPVFINKLSFQMMTLPDGIDTFISVYFNHLSKLKLKRCEFEVMAFSLPACQINTFQMEDDFTEDTRGFLVTTLQNNQQRWYSTAYIESRYNNFKGFNGFPTQHQAVKSRPITKIPEQPFFTLACYSFNNMVIRDALNC
jgi:hypothetical protein